MGKFRTVLTLRNAMFAEWGNPCRTCTQLDTVCKCCRLGSWWCVGALFVLMEVLELLVWPEKQEQLWLRSCCWRIEHFSAVSKCSFIRRQICVETSCGGAHNQKLLFILKSPVQENWLSCSGGCVRCVPQIRCCSELGRISWQCPQQSGQPVQSAQRPLSVILEEHTSYQWHTSFFLTSDWIWYVIRLAQQKFVVVPAWSVWMADLLNASGSKRRHSNQWKIWTFHLKESPEMVAILIWIVRTQCIFRESRTKLPKKQRSAFGNFVDSCSTDLAAKIIETSWKWLTWNMSILVLSKLLLSEDSVMSWRVVSSSSVKCPMSLS